MADKMTALLWVVQCNKCASSAFFVQLFIFSFLPFDGLFVSLALCVPEGVFLPATVSVVSPVCVLSLCDILKTTEGNAAAAACRTSSGGGRDM